MPYLDPQEVYDRAEQRLHKSYERGELSDQELHEEMRLLTREYRDMAAEAAQEEHDRWFQ